MRSSRFAPWLIFGCLLWLASCGKEETVPTSGAVGHVVSVQGEVRAQREGEAARAIEAEDVVYANDTIVTGPESNISIRLEHNGALWELGETSERRIDKGIAYRAKTKGSSTLDKETRAATTSAGRGTTRQAGDSTDTIASKDDEADSDPGDADPAGGDDDAYAEPSPEPAERERKDTSKRRGNSGRRLTEARDAKPAPKKPKRTIDPSADKKGNGSGLGTTTSDDLRQSGNGTATPTDSQEPAPAPPPPPPTRRDANETVEPASMQRAHVIAHARKCHAKHGGSGTISFAVGANGTFKASSVDASLAKTVACLRAAIRDDKLPNSTTISGSLALP